jgi:hypothetical protein
MIAEYKWNPAIRKIRVKGLIRITAWRLAVTEASLIWMSLLAA